MKFLFLFILMTIIKHSAAKNSNNILQRAVFIFVWIKLSFHSWRDKSFITKSIICIPIKACHFTYPFFFTFGLYSMAASAGRISSIILLINFSFSSTYPIFVAFPPETLIINFAREREIIIYYIFVGLYVLSLFIYYIIYYVYHGDNSHYHCDTSTLSW